MHHKLWLIVLTIFRNSYKMVVWTKLKCVNSELQENYFNSQIWFDRHKLKIIFLNGKSKFFMAILTDHVLMQQSRYCFYGCHCIPGLPVHDQTAGKGAPQDGIDGTCSHLRQCYLCAKDEHDGECDGATSSHGFQIKHLFLYRHLYFWYR